MEGNVIQPNGAVSGKMTLLGEIPITNMTYDSTDDSYGGTGTGSSALQTAVTNSPLTLVCLVGTVLNDSSREFVLGTVIIMGDQSWTIGNATRGVYFVGCLSDNTSATGSVYPRIKKFWFDNKIQTDSVKVRYYRINL